MAAAPSTIYVMRDEQGAYLDIPFSYTYDKVLTASATLYNESVPLDSDGEFLLVSMAAKFTSVLFSVRIQDYSGHYLSNAFVNWDNYQGNGAEPYMFHEPIRFPPGSQIPLDVREDSGSENTIQIVFQGIKRLRPDRNICL